MGCLKLSYYNNKRVGLTVVRAGVGVNEKIARPDVTAAASFFRSGQQHTTVLNFLLLFGSSQKVEIVDEGRILHNPQTSSFTYEYHLRDHLGSVRVAFEPTTGGNEVRQINAYYPFGAPIAALSWSNQLSNPNRYKREGKEYIDDFDLNKYDFGWRMFCSWTWRSWQRDPMAAKYYWISPYALFLNNPLRIIDPTGMEIEEHSKNLWLSQQMGLVMYLAYYHQNNKNGRYDERIALIQQTRNTMNTLETSDDQVYSLNSGAKDSELSFDKETNIITINYDGLELFAHEITHAGQYEKKELGFDAKTGKTFGQDIYKEVAAFKAQWAVNPSTVGGFKSADKITPKWVQNITNPKGEQPYKPGGANNTGVAPLNINSTKVDIVKAYPHLIKDIKFQLLPSSTTLKDLFPKAHYKK